VPVPLPDLVAGVSGRIATAVVAGAKGSANVAVTNSGDAPLDTTVRVGMFVSSDAAFDGADTAAGTPVDKRLRLKPGARKVVKLKFTYPDVPDGDYTLLGVVDPAGAITESNEANNAAGAPATVNIRHAFVDLTGSVPSPLSGTLAPGGRVTAPLVLQNLGSVTAKGSVTLTLLGTDPAGVAADVPLGQVVQRVSLKPGASRHVRVNFTLPGNVPVGPYTFTVTLDALAPLVDENPANNRVTGPAITIG
jgi:subtilase family serine protease